MLEAHPLASMFPMIEGAAFDDLVRSIKAHKLINPIVLLDGKILDGRNRYRACLAAGVEPKFVQYDESDPERWRALVDALNIQRRHLSESQRAMLAVELRRAGATPDEAGRTLNVGARTINKAAVVSASGDAEIIDLVQRGKVSAHRAEQVVKGTLHRADMLFDRRGPGRPTGNAHVYRFEKALDAVLVMKGHQRTITGHWRGDPDTRAKLSEVVEFLRSVLIETQEHDNANTGT